MKLLVLAPQPFFQNRGTPIATLKMLHVLSAAGHDVDLLTYHEGTPISVPNCRHLRIPAIPGVRDVPPGFSLFKLICDAVMCFYVLRLCRRQRYDAIHAVEESVFMAMIVRRWFGTPYIYDMDSSLPLQLTDHLRPLRLLLPLFRWLEGCAVRGSRGVVAVCQSLEDVAATHSQDIPIVRIEDASLLTERTGDPPEPTTALQLEGRIVMYVGNLQGYQGIDLLLDAFTHVYHKYRDAQLVIIGGSDEEISKYRQLAQRYGIDDRTHFLGPRPIELLGAYLEQANVLVSPRTLGNNTPMKLFSYLESGTPVIATRLSMHTQVLDNEISILAEPTPLEMARGICVLFENEALRTRIALAAQKRIEEQFCPAALDSKLTEFYEELADTLGCK